MFDIIIKYENYKFFLTLKDNTFYGYGLLNGMYTKLPTNILKLFELFKVSMDKVIIKDNVYKDKNNMFIYTFSNNELDINKFIYDNSVDALLYSKNSISTIRKFTLNKFTIITSVIIMSIFMTSSLTNYIIKDIIPDNIITSNDNTIFDKSLLGNYYDRFNSNSYINFVLDNMSKSNINELINNRIFGFNVKTFDKNNKDCLGFYNELNPNTVYISDKFYKDSFSYNSVLTHEFVHLTEMSSRKYNLIDEAYAEIITNEFFNYSTNSYVDEISVVKKLIETIGTKPILEYIYNNNENSISDSIKDYLTIYDVSEFLDCLKYDYDDLKLNNERRIKLEKYLTKIYMIKNNTDPSFIFSLINNTNKDYTLHKKYFSDNNNYITKSTNEIISKEEAVEKNYILPSLIVDKDSSINYKYLYKKDIDDDKVLLLFTKEEYSKLNIDKPLYSATEMGNILGITNINSENMTIKKEINIPINNNDIIDINLINNTMIK